jgi:hypothetical protein
LPQTIDDRSFRATVGPRGAGIAAACFRQFPQADDQGVELREVEPVRNGPLVHRNPHVSRFAYGAPTPLERLASLAPAGSPRPFSRRSRPQQSEPEQWDPVRLPLGSRLPINLRQFLTRQLGSIARVEDDAIVALSPRSGDLLMRELARAIRRFSAERAREAWNECAIGLARLEHEFFSRPEVGERAPVVLCLRCSAFGTGALDQHNGVNCIAVDLGSAVTAQRMNKGVDVPTPDAMHRAVENFRRAREAAGRPHYDLDCYVAGGQVVFTWRTLDPVA